MKVDYKQHVPDGYTLRGKQEYILDRLSQVRNSGMKFALCCLPVGLGKSVIAVSICNTEDNAYIPMPNNQLMAQYASSFEDVRLLRGRKWLPCTYEDVETNKFVIPLIQQGKVFRVEDGASCAGARCTKKPASKRAKILEKCAESGPCPYAEALDVASKAGVIVTNFHAFTSQNLYNPHMFGHRKVIIIDEAHTLHSFLRDYLTTGITIDRAVAPMEVSHCTTFNAWLAWLSRREQLATFSNEEARDAYKAKLERLEQIGEGVFGTNPIVSVEHDTDKESFRVEFVPNSVAGAAKTLIYDYADFVVLMSGSWGDVKTSMMEIGLDPNETAYIEVDSDFPAENRPIITAPEDLDLSHKNWESNLPKLAEFIKDKMRKHPNEKGLIHAPSFTKGWQLAQLLDDPRVMTHLSEDFHAKFKEFTSSTEPKVFISPSCVAGVDLKYDLCRWQVCVAVPYPPAGTGFYQRALSKGLWLLYNTHTLRQIMQMFGRPVRAADDWGITYLADTRFNGFLQKMAKNLPGWLKESFVRHGAPIPLPTQLSASK